MNSVPGVLKTRENLALVSQCDQEGLEHLVRPSLRREQMIGMAALGAPAHHLQAVPWDMLRAAFVSPTSCKSNAGRTPRALAEGDDRFQAGTDLSGLEATQHPGADPGLLATLASVSPSSSRIRRATCPMLGKVVRLGGLAGRGSARRRSCGVRWCGSVRHWLILLERWPGIYARARSAPKPARQRIAWH